MLAVPMALLYEICIWFAYFSRKKELEKEAEEMASYEPRLVPAPGTVAAHEQDHEHYDHDHYDHDHYDHEHDDHHDHEYFEQDPEHQKDDEGEELDDGEAVQLTTEGQSPEILDDLRAEYQPDTDQAPTEPEQKKSSDEPSSDDPVNDVDDKEIGDSEKT
jgi:hypothetical protein